MSDLKLRSCAAVDDLKPRGCAAVGDPAPTPTADQVVTLARFKVAGHFDHVAVGEVRAPIDPVVARLASGRCRSVPHGEVSLMLGLGWIEHVPPGGRYRLTDLGAELLAGATRRSDG